MARIIYIGLAAGLVAALLFGVVTTMSPLGMLLSYLAPLPVLIAALGWNHRSGLIATAAGAIVSAMFMTSAAGIVFIITVGVPAWWLAYLSLLGRGDATGQVEWYPLGRVLMWLAATAALITLIGAIALGPLYDAYQSSLDDLVRALVGAELTPDLPVDADIDRFVNLAVAVLPAVAAITFVFMLTLNLWLAAFTVRISDRLPRPWPSIPDTLMPRSALLITGFAGVGCVILPGYAGLGATALVGSMAAAFTLQGLASIHAMTRGNRARPVLLTLLYVSLLLLSVWVILILVGIGAAAVTWPSRRHVDATLPNQ